MRALTLVRLCFSLQYWGFWFFLLLLFVVYFYFFNLFFLAVVPPPGMESYLLSHRCYTRCLVGVTCRQLLAGDVRLWEGFDVSLVFMGLLSVRGGNPLCAVPPGLKHSLSLTLPSWLAKVTPGVLGSKLITLPLQSTKSWHSDASSPASL